MDEWMDGMDEFVVMRGWILEMDEWMNWWVDWCMDGWVGKIGNCVSGGCLWMDWWRGSVSWSTCWLMGRWMGGWIGDAAGWQLLPTDTSSRAVLTRWTIRWSHRHSYVLTDNRRIRGIHLLALTNNVSSSTCLSLPFSVYVFLSVSLSMFTCGLSVCFTLHKRLLMLLHHPRHSW